MLLSSLIPWFSFSNTFREGPILVVASGRDTISTGSSIKRLAPENVFLVQVWWDTVVCYLIHYIIVELNKVQNKSVQTIFPLPSNFYAKHLRMKLPSWNYSIDLCLHQIVRTCLQEVRFYLFIFDFASRYNTLGHVWIGLI